MLKRFDVTRILEPESKEERQYQKIMRKMVNRERKAEGMPPIPDVDQAPGVMPGIMEGYVRKWSPTAERVGVTEQGVEKPYQVSHRGDAHTKLWSRASEPAEVSAFEAFLQHDFNAGVVLM